MRYLTALCLFLSTAAIWAEDRPLPEIGTFLEQVRVRLQTDATLRRSYTYVETERRVKLDGAGRPTSESVRVVESYPGLPGEERWERVIEEDGRRVSEAELRKKDGERQKKAEQYVRTVTHQTEADRAKLARDQDKARRERADLVDDVFRVYEIVVLGRELVEGHETIAFSITPRPGATTKTRDGKWLPNFKGRAWVSESDYELVKLDVEAIKNMSIGMGLVARVHKGTRASFERRKINGEAWLPAKAQYTVSGRILLLKRLREGGTYEYSNYKKFSVDTSTTYTPPRPPE